MPTVKAAPSARVWATPPCCVAVTANSAAWVRVSKERANRAPTAAIASGCDVACRRRNRPALRPTVATISPAGAVRTARRLRAPSRVRKPIEIQVPRSSIHAGTCHCPAATPTASAISMTIAPCPSENSEPHQRARDGAMRRLWRVRPSMVARWSASSPCLAPRTNTRASRAIHSLGNSMGGDLWR